MILEDKASSKYIVKPGNKVNLAKLDSSDMALFPDGKSSYQEYFDKQRFRLQELQKVLYAQSKHRILFVIQAMDTGGKDGCVKHVFSYVNPMGIHVLAFKKPTEDELARDFLWRVHQHVPGDGDITIFNRSHYEDIIAVRVKKLFADEVWQRRYHMVNEFESMLADEGTTIVKFFLHISKKEQKERLEARLENPKKHWKFNPDDLKDRARWDDFQSAYADMIEKTTAKNAPWHIIPADRKWYRNIVVAQIVIDTLTSLKLDYPKADWSPSDFKIGD